MIHNVPTLEERILNWADERGIFDAAQPESQALKSASEMGELCDAVGKQDIEKIKDGIGDVYVTLVLQAHMQSLTMHECVEHAWNEIKDRKGQMVNGMFVKES